MTPKKPAPKPKLIVFDAPEVAVGGLKPPVITHCAACGNAMKADKCGACGN